MFVTASNFDIPPYNIPGLDKVSDTFTDFVTKIERKYLLEVLGSNLYNAFVSGLNSLPAEYDPTIATVISTQYVYGNDIWEALTISTGATPVEGVDWTLIEANRWLLLKNGNTYLMGDKYYSWVGITEALVPLIYSKWIEYTVIALTGNGFAVPITENNIVYSPSEFICSSWNDWSRQIGNSCSQHDTLYGYLFNVNFADGTFDDTFDITFQDFNQYLSFSFTSQGYKNVFGL